MDDEVIRPKAHTSVAVGLLVLIPPSFGLGDGRIGKVKKSGVLIFMLRNGLAGPFRAPQSRTLGFGSSRTASCMLVAKTLIGRFRLRWQRVPSILWVRGPRALAVAVAPSRFVTIPSWETFRGFTSTGTYVMKAFRRRIVPANSLPSSECGVGWYEVGLAPSREVVGFNKAV